MWLLNIGIILVLLVVRLALYLASTCHAVQQCYRITPGNVPLSVILYYIQLVNHKFFYLKQ